MNIVDDFDALRIASLRADSGELEPHITYGATSSDLPLLSVDVAVKQTAR